MYLPTSTADTHVDEKETPKSLSFSDFNIPTSREKVQVTFLGKTMYSSTSTTDNHDDEKDPPRSLAFSDFNIPTAREKVQLTFFGKIRSFHSISVLEWVYIAFSVIGLTISLGITIERIVSGNSKSDDFTFAILLLLTIVFCYYYVCHSVLTERADELLVFVCSNLIVLVYCVANYILQDRTSLKLVRLIVVSISSPFLIGVGYILSIKYCRSNNLILYTVGAISDLQKYCKLFYFCSSLLKFDLQLQLSMLILVMDNQGVSMDLTQKIVLGSGVAITLIFVVVGFLGLREENQILMIIFYILGLLEPAYVVYKFYILSTRKDTNSATYESTFACGSFALVVWVTLMASTGYYATYCFGKGLNEKIFGFGRNPSRAQPQSSPRTEVSVEE